MAKTYKVEFNFESKKLADEAIALVNNYMADVYGFKRMEQTKLEDSSKCEAKAAPSMSEFKCKLEKIIKDLRSNIGKNVYTKANVAKNFFVLKEQVPWFVARKGANEKTKQLIATVLTEFDIIHNQIVNFGFLRKCDLKTLESVLKTL